MQCYRNIRGFLRGSNPRVVSMGSFSESLALGGWYTLKSKPVREEPTTKNGRLYQGVFVVETAEIKNAAMFSPHNRVRDTERFACLLENIITACDKIRLARGCVQLRSSLTVYLSQK